MQALESPPTAAAPPALLEALEDHLIGVFGGTDVPGTSAGELPELNAIFRAELEPARMMEEVAEVLSHRPSPRWWWVGPGTHPRDLGRALLSFGLPLQHRRVGLALDLRAAHQTFMSPSPGLLQEARSAEDRLAIADQWARGGSPEIRAAAVDLAALLGARWVPGRDRFRFLLGWFNGRPVSVVGTHQAGPVAGVFGMVTQPEARRHGVARALLVAALRRAEADGAQYAVTVVPEEQVPFFERVGFARYGEFDIYRTLPQPLDDGPVV